MIRRLLSVLLLLAVPATAVAATIKAVKVADGREDANRIGTAVYDAAKIAPIRIGALQAAYNKKAKIVRRTGGFFTKGPEYDLDPAVNLADLYAEALRAEAPAMGLRIGSGSDPAWEISGTLKDVYMESHQVYMGATLFYGFMDVELLVKSPTGETRSLHWRFHNYHGAYNAGLGRKDEAAEGLAHLLVEGAQETVARLNRECFKAPAHPDMVKRVAARAFGKGNELHLLGLSGAPEAVPALLAILPETKDEDTRANIIAALGRIGSTGAIPAFASRYAGEEEDCRWDILKALDYIGGDEALNTIRAKGPQDEYDACQRLAKRIVG